MGATVQYFVLIVSINNNNKNWNLLNGHFDRQN
jgi:hypothetical protein